VRGFAVGLDAARGWAVGLGVVRGLAVGLGVVRGLAVGLGVVRGLAVGLGVVRALRLGLAGARSARAAALCRAAALRALGRWGRVLGRLESTPGSSAAPAAARVVLAVVRVAPVAGGVALAASRVAAVGGAVAPVRRRSPDRFSSLVGLIGVRNHRASGAGIRDGRAQALI
jgi:hypothetical protein